MSGWQMLGNAMGGGVETARQDAYMEGQHIGAKTQNALAQARTRRIDEAQKMQEYEARKNMQESLVQAFGLDTTQAAGMAGLGQANMGNVQQLMQARNTNQEFGFRERAADVDVPFSEGQRALMGVASGPVERTGSGQGMLWDRFSDDPMGSAVTTPGTEASIRQRDAAASLSAARESWGPQGRAADAPEDLSSLILGINQLPTGIDPTINFNEGVGAPAWAARLGNVIAGVIPGMDMPAPDRERAINALEDLQARSIMSAKALVNQRMSNQLMDLMTSLTVKPADILRGDQRALMRYAQTRDFMQAKAQEIEFMLTQPGGTNSQRHGLRNDLIVMTNLANAYGQVVSQFENPQSHAQGAVQRPGAEPDVPAPEGIDPEDWRYMSPEDRALWN